MKWYRRERAHFPTVKFVEKCSKKVEQRAKAPYPQEVHHDMLRCGLVVFENISNRNSSFGELAEEAWCHELVTQNTLPHVVLHAVRALLSGVDPSNTQVSRRRKRTRTPRTLLELRGRYIYEVEFLQASVTARALM